MRYPLIVGFNAKQRNFQKKIGLDSTIRIKGCMLYGKLKCLITRKNLKNCKNAS